MRAYRAIGPKNDRQYMTRLSAQMLERLKKRAWKNGRSVNTEIVQAVQDYLDRPDVIGEIAALEQRICSLEETRSTYGQLFGELISARVAELPGWRPKTAQK